MKNQPLVSVALVAYNQGKYIQEAILSIINQTYNNIELIIVDDGSTDDTLKKIKELEELCKKRFIRLTIETQANSGSCAALTKAYKLCKGEYIYDIAADDVAKPQAIQKEVEFLQHNTDYALVVGDNEIIDENNQRCYWDKNRNSIYDIKKAKYKTFCDFLQRLKKLNFSLNIFGTYPTLYTGNYIPNGYLIRKSIFKKIGYFTPEAPLEDYWLMLQISQYAKMKYIDEILFSYRWHHTNTVKNISKMSMIAEKTSKYEETILSQLNEKEVLPEVVLVKKYGTCYKKQGIPYIFQVLSYKRINCRRRVIKLFNIKIIEYERNIK